MFRNLAPATVFAAALAVAGGLAPDAALAAGCLSSKEARSAVQNGQAVSLSKMVKRTEQALVVYILPTLERCKNGGRLPYTVKALKPDGSVETLTVDAASGNIAGY